MIKVTNVLTEHGKQIREEVFIHEQGFTIEIDEVDNYAYHVVYYKNDVAVAVCRFFNDNNSSTYHIGRFAVKKDYRNQHIGKDMLIKVLDKIKEIGGKKVVLSSQLTAVEFYLKCGFKITSELYYEQHCPHKDMELDII